VKKLAAQPLPNAKRLEHTITGSTCMAKAGLAAAMKVFSKALSEREAV
jgi:hypothetical protein